MNNLEELRKQIDEIDNQLVKLYVKRMDVVRLIAAAKADNNVALVNCARESAIVERLSKDVSDSMKPYIKELYETIFHTSKAYQVSLINKSSFVADSGEKR